MDLRIVAEKKPYIGLIVSSLFAVAILLGGLGSFGIWEPHELSRAESAEQLVTGKASGRARLDIENRLAAVSWSCLGKSELSTRLPSALLALIAVAAFFLLGRSLMGGTVTLFGALVLLTSPLLLFHGRQLTGGMPTILGEVLSVLGLTYAIRAAKPRGTIVGLLVGAVGLLLGWVSSNLLVGVFAPLATVTVAGLMIGGRPSDAETPVKRDRRRTLFLIVLGGAAVVAIGVYLSIVFFSKQDFPLVTGGLQKKSTYALSFEFSFGQLAYGWFPWSAFAPVCVMAFFKPATREDEGMLFARALAIGGILLGYLAHTLSLHLSGLSPSLVAVPMALAAALAVNDMARSEQPLRIFGLIGFAMMILMVRDFILDPVKILSGYGFDKIDIPKKDYAPAIKLAIFALPAGLLLLGSFLVPGRWRTWYIRVLALAAPVAFGGFVVFSLVPGFSVHLSSKHAVEAYEHFRKGNEPLAVYGPSRFFSEAKPLESLDDVVKWLKREDRVFAVFPPKNLPEIDRRMRDGSGRNIFVLDAKSDRFLVATSKALPGEKNENPLASYTSSTPFNPGPSHPLAVNFDDKVTLVGWDLKSPNGADRLTQGKELTFTSYWHVKEHIPGDYKIFMHIDGPGGRLHGDHDPFDGQFPTSQWAKGDYIKEVYKKEVPLYQQAGSYKINMGLFKEAGGARLPIKDEPNASQNSLTVTRVMLD